LIADGLERFSGNAVRREWDSAQTGLVLSFVLCYILGVSGFCWGLRERSQWRKLPEGRGFPFRVAFALGSSVPIVVIGISLMAMIGAYISNSVWATMKEAQRQGANRDYTINNLSIMALNAQSFWHVSVAEGGGGGKWANIKGGASSSLTLERIAVKDPGIKRVLESFFPQETPTFRLEIFDEDSIGIWGIGNEEGDLPLFVNKDGREGRGQSYVIVTPRNSIIRRHN
jgi:hypothetical protein